MNRFVMTEDLVALNISPQTIRFLLNGKDDIVPRETFALLSFVTVTKVVV